MKGAGIELNAEKTVEAMRIQAALKEVGIELEGADLENAIEAKGAIQRAGIYKTDSGTVVGMSNNKQVKG
jgi:hypothetical protein